MPRSRCSATATRADLTCTLVDLAYADDARCSATGASAADRDVAATPGRARADDGRANSRGSEAQRAHGIDRWHRCASGSRAVDGVRTRRCCWPTTVRYGFVDAVNPSDAARTFGPLRVALAGGDVAVAPFRSPPRVRAPGSGRLLGLPARARAASAGDCDAAAVCGDRRREVLAGRASSHRVRARCRRADLRSLSATGLATNAATQHRPACATPSIPQPPVSPRDYIARLHASAPGGNVQSAVCVQPRTPVSRRRASPARTTRRIFPPAARASRERCRSGGRRQRSSSIDERFAPADPASHGDARERLRLCISSAATRSLRRPAQPFVGILHGTPACGLRWRPATCIASTLRADARCRTRHARLRTPPVELRLGVYEAADAAEAGASSKRIRRSSSGEVAERQTQPPQKRPRQLVWVRIPPSLYLRWDRGYRARF